MMDRIAELIQNKMIEALQPTIAINNFLNNYFALSSGETGFIPEDSIQPVTSAKSYDAIRSDKDFLALGELASSKTVVLKLNGGLGTTMGLLKPKSTLTVKDNYTFLDIIAKQAEFVDSPYLFMTSLHTETETRDAINRYHALQRLGGSGTFRQHIVPKLRQDNLYPVTYPIDPSLEWCPPGHGDALLSLHTSGMLDDLLCNGYQYLFISNSDNLGAVLDKAILGYMVGNKLSFLMELVQRTEMDQKGGHIAQYSDGKYVLREIAQCADDDKVYFKDISRHRLFNINNLWIDIKDLKEVILNRNFDLRLPLSVSKKFVNPSDSNSVAVYQLETALGSAIKLFDNVGILQVPRNRFSPVKTTTDLLLIRSDVYKFTPDFRIVLDEQLSQPPLVILDDRYYKNISDFEERFAGGIPSLVRCKSLNVHGDIHFAKGMELIGDCTLSTTT